LTKGSVAGRPELGEFGVDVDGDGAEQPDVLTLGWEMWVRISSSMWRPWSRNCRTARPRYSAVQVLMAFVAMVRHHACSV
jgi:hypothetical protein